VTSLLLSAGAQAVQQSIIIIIIVDILRSICSGRRARSSKPAAERRAAERWDGRTRELVYHDNDSENINLQAAKHSQNSL